MAAKRAIETLQCNLDPAMPADAALRVLVGHCLHEIRPHAAAVLGGSENPQDLHQLRVAIRRLRSVLHEFHDWSADCDPAWQPALAQLFGRLGQARDQQILIGTVLPPLRAAGMPALKVAALPPTAAGASILGGDDWPALCAALQRFADGVAPAGSPQEQVRPLAVRRLRRLHRQANRQAGEFEALDDSSRHRLRKRVKRLRYNLELLAALFPSEPVARYLRRLQPIQDALGEFNDQVVAMAWLSGQTERQPQAWFGLGWLSARHPKQLRRTARVLQRFARLPAFLRRPD